MTHWIISQYLMSFRKEFNFILCYRQGMAKNYTD